MRSIILSLASAIFVLAACANSSEVSQPAARPIVAQNELSTAYIPSSEAGQLAVDVREGEWTERRRLGSRTVPWKAYLPDATAGAAPIVVWSHGLGGSRNGSESLGRHLASHGIAAFHIQHPGTDTSAISEGGMASLMRDIRERPSLIVDRLRDVPFAVDEITRMAESTLADRIDASRIGMSGHSFGAITTLSAAGQRANNALIGTRFAEPRFKAAFIMSPSPPRRGSAEAAFDNMLMPLFHLTGTEDASPIGDLEPAQRKIPYTVIDDVDQYLLEFNGGTHFTYTDTTTIRGRSLAYDGLERHKDIMRAAALAYWDGYLRDDPAALAWLRDGGLQSYAGDFAFVSFKPASK
ncbi:MAG: hypothetical protein AAGB02_05465 [Pseudomonadota bacterium]